MGYWTEDPIERLENKKDELVGIMTTIERQKEFVAWLEANGMYNSMESAHTMQQMHKVWEASRLPSDSVVMPKELTAENGAKGLLIGEFFEPVEIQCGECVDIGEIEEDCYICEGRGHYLQQVPVSWTIIKEIYAMAVKHFSA